jgi:hypothetical protein
VLPAALRSNWDNPDALYGGIVQALADDFIEEATEAVEHLHELEPGSARSITSLAYLRLRQKRVDEGAPAARRLRRRARAPKRPC